MADVDEDFWNTTGADSWFDFDDEDEETYSEDAAIVGVASSSSVFSSTAEEVDTLPIHLLISKKNLDLVLEDVRLPSVPIVSSIEDTIKRAFLGKPCVLTSFRTLDEKCCLLDQAISTHDGNIILLVILFLAKSLKRSIFLRIISGKKVAVKHYEVYLKENNKLQQLSDLYMATGNSMFILDLFYLSCKNSTSNTQIKAKLEQFLQENSFNIQSEREKSMLNDYNLFLKWQLKSDISCETATEALALLCKYSWERNKDESRILEFRSDMKICDFQFEWIHLNTLAFLSMWKKLTDIFIKPNWLTKKSSLKSVIDLEVILTTLHKHDAPKPVLEDFLTCMVDADKSIMLAKKWDCHRFVIDAYSNLKDRLALVNYTNILNSQSEYFFYAKNMLKTERKWKN